MHVSKEKGEKNGGGGNKKRERLEGRGLEDVSAEIFRLSARKPSRNFLGTLKCS